MALISSTDFENLPTEPTQRWLKLRDLAETRLVRYYDTQEGVTDRDLLEYCSILSAAAEELNLGALPLIAVANSREEYEFFRFEVTRLATRLSLRANAVSLALSVAISRPTKSKINVQIDKLRKLISESSLPNGQKHRLSDKLDELQSLVVAQRTDFGKVMRLIAYVAAAVGGTTAFIADAPDAIATIAAFIGEEKEAEEEELQKIEQAKGPLALPDLSNKPQTDDNLPF